MRDAMAARIRVIIADDHPIFRQGLREVIEEDPELMLVGEAADGAAAFERIQTLEPDVAVLDIGMPKQDGFTLARLVRERELAVKIVFLTMYKEEDALNRALDLGVRGYVLKDGAAAEIVNGIKAVAAGAHYISPAVSSYLVARSARAAEPASGTGLDSLTRTERRILTLIAHKKTSKEIGQELFISPRTVDNHRANICLKLDLHGSNALLKFALDHKSELS